MVWNNYSTVILRKITSAVLIFWWVSASAQMLPDSTTDATPAGRTPAGVYKRGSFYNFIWGKHYRKEWATPVKVRVIHLDTAFGGLKILQASEENQVNKLLAE